MIGRFNHLLIAALVVAHLLISLCWYSPFLFGYKWINVSNFQLSAVPPYNSIAFYWPFLVSIVNSIVFCYALAYLFMRLSIQNLWQGVLIGFALWFTFVFLFTLSHHQFAQQELALTLIDTGRDLVVVLLSSLTLAVFSRRNGSHE